MFTKMFTKEDFIAQGFTAKILLSKIPKMPTGVARKIQWAFEYDIKQEKKAARQKHLAKGK